MRQSLIIANWKMNGDAEFHQQFINTLLEQLPEQLDLQVAICPSQPYLFQVANLLKNSPITCGAQNCAAFNCGAYTGETAASMLQDLGCQYALLGHSERRQYFREKDELIVQKIQQVWASKLIPVLCVGESQLEYEAGLTESVVARQLQGLLSLNIQSKIVIAYEPIWAIGTGLTATPEQAQSVHAMIREQLQKKSSQLADDTQILYGGSVKPSNFSSLLAMPDIDGGLVGGASLDIQQFLELIQCSN